VPFSEPEGAHHAVNATADKTGNKKLIDFALRVVL